MRAYLFADPAGHSLSPAMHAAAFAHAGLDGTYEARRVTAEHLPDAVRALQVDGTLGANVSLPHKEHAARLVTTLSDAARAIGAVNTIVNTGGDLHGDNTDAPGLLAALRDASAPDGPAVVLGAGGAARAAVWSLAQEGRDVWVVNRTPDRAQALARELGGRFTPEGEVPWGDVHLLVNATSAGLGDPDATPLPDLPPLARGALVYDMVYRPAVTRLMRQAQHAGLRAENGLGMLAHQARLSFRAWTGADVPASVFLNAAREALGG